MSASSSAWSGSAAQQADLLPRTLQEDWFWGNALNPRDTRLKARRAAGGWWLDGVKSYASGSVGSDRLLLSAVAPQADGRELQLVGHVATRAPGVHIMTGPIFVEGAEPGDMLEVRNRMKAKEAAGGKKTLLLGPNCPGLITPDEIKIGIMPGHIHRKGRIGVVSRSGTLTYEAVAQLTEIGLGQSSAVGIGGDPINGLKHIDVMKAYNDDPETDAVIMIGEIGGPDEAEAARWCKAHMKKPVVGFIAGVTAPPGKRMGHAGALISGGADTADAKLAIMEECGFKVTRNPSEMGKLLKGLL